MRTQAVEDYLKVIYDLSRSGGPVTTSALASRLSVSPASVTGMVKKLAKLNLVAHEHYRGVELTEAGRKIALEVIRHHRLVEKYLYEALGIPWDQVHAEAEKWEHVLSEEMARRIDEALGSPTTDPHGSPIPTRELEMVETSHPTLAELSAGQRARVAEVGDEDPAMLRYFAELGLFPETSLEVVSVAPFEGPMTLRVEGIEQSIGRPAAAQVFVTDVEEEEES
jgi:DtxR family transcriptional regulator, Mn-dependent transcriptional regulator